MTDPAETDELWAAFCAGVNSTMEGCNGEYGASDEWVRERFEHWVATGMVEDNFGEEHENWVPLRDRETWLLGPAKWEELTTVLSDHKIELEQFDARQVGHPIDSNYPAGHYLVKMSGRDGLRLREVFNPDS